MIFAFPSKQNVASASERLHNYLSWRTRLFGDLRPQSIDSCPALKLQLESMFIRLLPDPLPTGEAVLYLELCRHEPSLYTAEQTVQTWHYLILSSIQKFPHLSVAGFVIIGNMTDASYANMDLGVPEAIASAVHNIMPVRVVNFFIINPSFVMKMVVPVVKLILSSKIGQRIHIVSDISALYDVHGLDPLYFPEAIGGSVPLEKTQTCLSSLLTEQISV